MKQLRRAWLEPGDVLNTREAEDFLGGVENRAVAVACKQGILCSARGNLPFNPGNHGKLRMVGDKIRAQSRKVAMSLLRED